MELRTRPDEFKRFHYLITKDNDYEPYYFPLEKNGKDPLANVSWKKNRKTYSEALKLMEQGYNIGIAATDEDRLVIVDIDNMEAVPEYKPTLVICSRKRIGRHCFYFTDDKVSTNIFDDSAKQNIATGGDGEVRSNWQYVVASGSYVPCAPEEIDKIPINDRDNAGYYTVMVEHNVNEIVFNELPDAYKNCIQNKRANEVAHIKKQEMKEQNKHVPHRDGNRSAMWDLTVFDIFGKKDNPHNRFASPFHTSDTHKNTSASNGLIHCWRHNVSHNALTSIAVLCGLADCGDAGYGHNHSGTTCIDMEDGRTVFEIWKYAKDQRYIPENDPIPTSALVHYAVKEAYCNKDDIIDGWKLPVDIYNKVIKTTDFKSGREEIHGTAIKRGVQKSISNPMDIAESLQEMYPTWFDPSRNIWMWDKRTFRYTRIDETDILCQITQAMEVEDIYKSHVKNEILECIRITGRMRNVKDTPKEWIQFHDCVVDVTTGERFEPTPDYFFASRIPHNFGKNEDTPTIDKLFTDWVGEENKQTLYEICAYCLYDHYPIHRIFTFIGTGRNGKGQFMTLLKRFIGADNCVSTDLDRISNSRFETAKLYKKKAAFIGETNFNTLSRTNMLKSMSGGDTVPGEFKGRDSFDFVNTAKIIIATNALPETTDKTDGFYRRWMIVDFANKFEEGKDVIDEIPSWEYENLATKSMKLLRNLLDVGKFYKEGTISERAAKYEAKSNPINKFIEDNCIQDVNEKMPYWYLYDRYIEHCDVAGHRKVTKKEFTSKLKNIGFELKQARFNKYLAAMYKNCDSSEINEQPNWMAIIGIGWESCSQCSQCRSKIHSLSPIGNRSEVSSTSSTSSTNDLIISKISADVKRFELEFGIINKSNLVDATHMIAHWSKIKPSDVQPVIEKLCKIA